jgi:hypothetical protein
VDAWQHGLDSHHIGMAVLAQALLAAIWQISFRTYLATQYQAKLALKKSKVLCWASAAASACHAPR